MVTTILTQGVVLRNHYGVDMGTSGLIIQAESREEILADKMVAFALRPNRLKYRDLWDIGWLKQQNISLRLEWVAQKVEDHRSTAEGFLALLEQRVLQVHDQPEIRDGFVREMQRFLPPQVIRETVAKKEYWQYLTDLLEAESKMIMDYL